jgi:hypothetical protein
MAQEAIAAADGSAGPQQQPDVQVVRVLYLMGAGRSGSTILGVALGNCEGVFYAGELDKWLARRGEPPLEGEERERFWAVVRERVPAEDMFGPHGRSFERSSLLAAPRAWRTRRRLRSRYREVAAGLLAATSSTAGAEVVVDSSHYPLRARELQRAPGLELHLVLLLRDPQAIVSSLARTDVPERSFGVLAANAYLWLTYALSMWVFSRQPRARRRVVRHEQFLADPRGVLTAILSDFDGERVPAELGALRTGPVFQGNRLVRGESVELARPHTSSPPTHSRLTAILQWPLQRMLARLGPVADPREGAPGREQSDPR